MALARVLNSPHRGLDHMAFTHLKRYARLKNMPMYQVGVTDVLCTSWILGLGREFTISSVFIGRKLGLQNAKGL